MKPPENAVYQVGQTFDYGATGFYIENHENVIVHVGVAAKLSWWHPEWNLWLNSPSFEVKNGQLLGPGKAVTITADDQISIQAHNSGTWKVDAVITAAFVDIHGQAYGNPTLVDDETNFFTVEGDGGGGGTDPGPGGN